MLGRNFLVLQLFPVAHAYFAWQETVDTGGAKSNRTTLDLAQCGERQWSERPNWGWDDPVLRKERDFVHQTLKVQRQGRYSLLHSPTYEVQAQIVKCSEIARAGGCFNGLAVNLTRNGTVVSAEWRCDFVNGKMSCKLQNQCGDEEKFLTPCTGCSAAGCAKIEKSSGDTSISVLTSSMNDWYRHGNRWRAHSRDQIDMTVTIGKRIDFKLSAVVQSEERIDVQIGVPTAGKGSQASGICGRLQDWHKQWQKKYGQAPECLVVAGECRGLNNNTMALDGECQCEDGQKLLTNKFGKTVPVSFTKYEAEDLHKGLRNWADSWRVGVLPCDGEEAECRVPSLFKDDMETRALQDDRKSDKEGLIFLSKMAHDHVASLDQRLGCPIVLSAGVLRQMKEACQQAVSKCVKDRRIIEKDLGDSAAENALKEEDVEEESSDDVVAVCMTGLELGVDDLSNGCEQEGPKAIKSWLDKQYVQGEACLSHRAAMMNYIQAGAIELAGTAATDEIAREALTMEQLHEEEAGEVSVNMNLQPCRDAAGKLTAGLYWSERFGELLSTFKAKIDPETPGRMGAFWIRGTDRHAKAELPEGEHACFFESEVSTHEVVKQKTRSDDQVKNTDIHFYVAPLGGPLTNKPIQLYDACQKLGDDILPVCNKASTTTYMRYDGNKPPMCASIFNTGRYFSYYQHSYKISIKDRKALTWCGMANRGAHLYGKGNSHAWATVGSTGFNVACISAGFNWKYTLPVEHAGLAFNWRLERKAFSTSQKADILGACKARNLPPLCGCDQGDKRDGKCLPLSMHSLRQSDKLCVSGSDNKLGSDEAWNLDFDGWWHQAYLYDASEAYGRYRGTASNKQVLNTICANVRFEIMTEHAVAEIFRVPIQGDARNDNIVRACAEFDTMGPLCDDGSKAGSGCVSIGNAEKWSEAKDVGFFERHGLERQYFFEAMMYSGGDGYAAGTSPAGAINITDTNAKEYENMATYCVTKLTNKVPKVEETFVPKCTKPRKRWQNLLKSTQKMMCDARGIDLVVVVNEAEYMTYPAVKPNADEKEAQRESWQSFSMPDFASGECLGNSTSSGSCSAIGGYNNLHRFIPRLLEQFGNTCEDGKVNRVGVVVNTGNGARPVEFACTGQDSNVDPREATCANPLSYLVAETALSYKNLDIACTNTTQAQGEARLALSGLSLKVGWDTADVYSKTPLCDSDTFDEVHDHGPCWTCRAYNTTTGRVREVSYDELTYRFTGDGDGPKGKPICMNPAKCPNNPLGTGNASHWTCAENDFFLSGQVGYGCISEQSDGLSKAVDMLEKEQSLSPEGASNHRARKHAIVFFTDGWMRGQQGSGVEDEIDEKVIEQIQFFAEQQNTQFVAVEMVMDEKRGTNRKFFERLHSMKKTGSMHVLDGMASDGSVHDRIENVKRHLTWRTQQNPAQEVNQMGLLRSICSVQDMEDQVVLAPIRSVDDLAEAALKPEKESPTTAPTPVAPTTAPPAPTPAPTPAAGAPYSLQETGKYCKNRDGSSAKKMDDVGACAEYVQQRSGCGVWWMYYPSGTCYCVPESADCDLAKSSTSGAKVYKFEAAAPTAVPNPEPTAEPTPQQPNQQPRRSPPAPQDPRSSPPAPALPTAAPVMEPTPAPRSGGTGGEGSSGGGESLKDPIGLFPNPVTGGEGGSGSGSGGDDALSPREEASPSAQRPFLGIPPTVLISIVSVTGFCGVLAVCGLAFDGRSSRDRAEA